MPTDPQVLADVHAAARTTHADAVAELTRISRADAGSVLEQLLEEGVLERAGKHNGRLLYRFVAEFVAEAD